MSNINHQHKSPIGYAGMNKTGSIATVDMQN